MALILLVAAVLIAQTGSTVRLPTAPAQTPQPRDPRSMPQTGTGVVRGRVTAADSGVPFRRAVVQLMGGARPRAVYTDDDGRFTFEAVAPGSYAVSANPGQHRAAYRQAIYGVDPTRVLMMTPPRRIEVVNGQTVENIDIAIPRGAAITGRVTDPAGEPAARVQVRAMMIRPGQEPMQTGGASTDDLGHFRIFGLMPGDYLLVAEPQAVGMNAEVEGDRLGFARTFAPGTSHRDDATRLRLRGGEDVAVDIRLLETAVFDVQGSVVNSRGEPVRTAGVSLLRADTMSGGGGGSGLDQAGQFTIRNVAPGSYDLLVNYAPPDARPDATGRVSGREMGTLRVDVTSADVRGLVITTAPGATITGRIVFDEPPPPGTRAQIFLQPGGLRPFSQTGAVTVKDDVFTVSDVFGPMLIRGGVSGPMVRTPPPPGGIPLGMSAGWTLKEVLLNGKDITDIPTAFTAAHNDRIQVVFTSRAPSITGTVTDDAGRPVRGAMIVAFPADEESWTANSSRLKSAPAMREDGRFNLPGLRPGRYYVAAVEAVSPMGGGPSGPDREFLRALKAVATEVVLNENESRTVDLRLIRIE